MVGTTEQDYRKTDEAPGPLASHVFGSADRYVESLLWVRSRYQRKIVPFILNPAQRYIQARKREAIAQGRPMRFLEAKARQLGITTMEQAFSFALVANYAGRQAVTLTDIDAKTRSIFRMVNLFHEHLHEDIRPHRRNEGAMTMLDYDILGSTFRVGTAGSVSFGRGDTIDRVHGSEVAYWLRGRSSDVVAELIAGLTEATIGEVVLESTSNGNSGWWFEACMAAARGESDWTLIFVPWWLDPSYRVMVSAEMAEELRDTLDDRERWLIDVHGLDLGQLAWRRSKLKSLGDLFHQEYPETLEESFLAAEVAFFPKWTLDRAAESVRQPDRVEDGWAFWGEVDPDHTYVIGADPAEGVDGGDFSAAYLLDFETGEQVARYRERSRPEVFASKLCKMGRHAGTALIGCEREGIGSTALFALYNVERYPRLYFEKKVNEKRRATKKLGWSTNALSRPSMLDDLREMVIADQDWINDPLWLTEARVFEHNAKGRPEARSGHHDDLVMAQAIATQMRKRKLSEPRVTVA